MDPLLLLEQAFNGLQFGVMLFLIAAGLTLVFGIMDLVNLAHGSLVMIGAYLATTLIAWTDSFIFGIALALPPGFEAQVRPRSGLALRHGVTVLNAPGTIDSDFRGEIEIILMNHGREPYDIIRGQRIAQLVIAPVTRAEWQRVTDLPATGRGGGGFGSTGT